MIRHLALALAVSLPLAAGAETPEAPAPPAPAASQPGPAAPSAVQPPVVQGEPGPPSPRRPAITIDLGGELQWNAFATFGGASVDDLPRFAGPPRGERDLGMSVRQSRLRGVVTLPSDGRLGGVQLRGLAEVDFMGGVVGAGPGALGDPSLPIVGFRHGYVTASWEELGHLTVLVGQTSGLFEGPHAALSLARLAVPRFEGAGALWRRAPQLRVSGELGRELSLLWSGAVLAPIDRATAPVPSATSPTSVGERSGLPDVEGRLAGAWRPGPARGVELGLSAHAGRETYQLHRSPTVTYDGSVDSWGGAVDLLVQLPRVTLVGAAFAGKNMDVFHTVGVGVAIQQSDFGAGTGAATFPSAVTGISTRGLWGQAQITPLAGLQLLVGGGLEVPAQADLVIAGPPAATTAVRRNGQASAGAVLDLTSAWRVSLEYTHYVTHFVDVGRDRYLANQLEVATLLAF